MYGEEIRKKNKAMSLCGLCVFDVLLVFSSEADNQSLTTSLYHLTGSWGEECVCVCMRIGEGRYSDRNCVL